MINAETSPECAYLLNCSYDKIVKIDFDPVKSEQNTKLRSLSFDRADDFGGSIS